MHDLILFECSKNKCARDNEKLLDNTSSTRIVKYLKKLKKQTVTGN